jgi:hypothetical protein
MAIVNKECLYKYWINSYEEDEQGKKVYRTSNFEFPPSFGRDALEIRKNGEIIFSFAGKDDRRVRRVGQFQIRDSDKIDVNLEGKCFTLTVLSCESDRLVIQENR